MGGGACECKVASGWCEGSGVVVNRWQLEQKRKPARPVDVNLKHTKVKKCKMCVYINTVDSHAEWSIVR